MEWLNKKWDEVKAWFKYSWSIFLARLEVLSGLVIGALTGIDWSALAHLDWSQGIKSTNAVIVAAILVVKGIVSEIGRRTGTVEVNSQMIPTNVAEQLKK